MDNPRVIHDCEPPPTRNALALPESEIARLALALIVVAAALLWYANEALGATLTLQDGERIEGEIVYATTSAIIIREPTGALVQLGRRTIVRVELATDKPGALAGTLESWAEGVYEIKTEDKVFRVQGRRIIAERRIFPKIIVTSAEEKEDAAKLVFELSLSKSVKQEVLLIYSTADGTALAGLDYKALRGSVILKPGSTDAMVSVLLLDDDLAEGDETFELLVTSDMNLATIKLERGSATILDNEAPAASQ